MHKFIYIAKLQAGKRPGTGKMHKEKEERELDLWAQIRMKRENAQQVKIITQKMTKKSLILDEKLQSLCTNSKRKI